MRWRRPKLRRLLRLTVDGTARLAGGLGLLLFVACLVLFGFFVAPEPTYKNIQPLLSKRTNTSAGQEAMRDIAVQVRGMETSRGIDAALDPERADLVQQRAAVNILLRSGYLARACARVRPEDAPLSQYPYELVLEQGPKSCAAVPLSGAEDDEAIARAEQASRLAIAAVAVEKFNRSAVHRHVEWAYADTFLALTGRLPDLSLGPAQIRPSTIRRMLAETGGRLPNAMLRATDTELAGMLHDECRSLELAALLMLHALTKSTAQAQAICTASHYKACPSPQDMALQAYAGRRRNTQAVIDYGTVVKSMGIMLDNQGVCDIDAADKDVPEGAANDGEAPAPAEGAAKLRKP